MGLFLCRSGRASASPGRTRSVATVDAGSDRARPSAGGQGAPLLAILPLPNPAALPILLTVAPKAPAPPMIKQKGTDIVSALVATEPVRPCLRSSIVYGAPIGRVEALWRSTWYRSPLLHGVPHQVDGAISASLSPHGGGGNNCSPCQFDRGNREKVSMLLGQQRPHMVFASLHGIRASRSPSMT